MFNFFAKRKSAQQTPEQASDGQRKAARGVAAIIQSGAQEAFQAKRPISDPDYLVGRDEWLDLATIQLSTPGGQILIYGDRGIGKSSLGLVVGNSLRLVPKFAEFELKRTSCMRGTTFPDIFAEALMWAGHDVSVEHVHINDVTQDGQKISGGVGTKGFGASGEAERSKKSGVSRQHIGVSENARSPRWVASQLKDKPLILFIDELENVQNEEVQKAIGAFIRAVSDDPDATIKIILAGIGATAASVTGGHSSVARNMTEIKLDVLDNDSIREIITRGSARVTIPTDNGPKKLVFTPKMQDEIVKRSMGYPYFTNLICLSAAENAVRRGDHIVNDDFELEAAVAGAVRAVSGDLKDSLDLALGDGLTSISARLLRIAVETTNSIITTDEWISAYQERYSEISAQKLSGSIRKFTKTEDEIGEMSEAEVKPIFVRVRPGVYSFHDPRMPSFIRLRLSGAANEGQLEGESKTQIRLPE